MTELLHLENYSFTYPQQRRPALSHVTLTLPEGAFMVLCGPSGCGKSTLLRQLKTVLAPHGLREGEITFCGTPLSQIPSRRQAAEIGFVQQSPENQVVTDKVWQAGLRTGESGLRHPHHPPPCGGDGLLLRDTGLVL